MAGLEAAPLPIRLLVPAALLLALALPLAGAGVPAPAAVHVHIQNFAFSPAEVTIGPGETVTWDNHDTAPHTVTADDGSWDSDTLLNGQSYSRAFPQAGTFAYFCAFHAGMTAKVKVRDPNALPDLTVSALTYEETLPGYAATVSVTVRNLGANDAGASKVRVTYTYQGQTHLLGEPSVPALGPLESATVTVDWDTLGLVGDFPLQALADSAGAVAEADEGNNLGETVAGVLVGGVPGTDLLAPL